ncbi:RNA polymerase Rpb7, N-terminal domain-containing protein, putative [Eimeria tenella]|uniref:RNA polymerase Rpb7, N-terminal domain-containing protein, putative n=1 Tax=Eimeria tenella TaxID=5802 RepID=U6L6G4_EIMTE|nr:RNA polymerase Rpb7, N-terminal domain-containing protein, putative [Eimeria tenella]CDJ44793.1 RNA polymerase Rpb7, N-terminal domain-containing protein, putative [Eimeria tenella]|eukprot:XP_013235541.1 RNA polymerase Rpb7, N-terminal domain-containing protein, putative [Eimeria tenella]
MFIISLLQDILSVEPSLLGRPLEPVLREAIALKYTNKVLRDLGLFVCLYDITEITGAPILLSSGKARYNVCFKAVIFRPFIGEVLQGIVCESSPSGIAVDMEFFKDVKIPASNLREPKACEEPAAAAAAAGTAAAAAAAAAEGKTQAAAVWSWCFEGHKLTYELGAPIRFRVADVVFAREEAQKKFTLVATEETYVPPMVIIGEANADGLGMLSWWQ